jgi:hypothetical protein
LRRFIVGGIAALGLLSAAPVVAPAPPAYAKSCSTGYRHGVINGAQKCLRRGEFCAHSADRQYHRYGFHCHRRTAYGYRLA